MAEDKFKEGTKFDTGKLQFNLLPPAVLLEVALVFTKGAEKYERGNWSKGLDYSRCIDAAKRHFEKYLAGEMFDDELGTHHLANVIANLIFLMEQDRFKPERDDRFPQDLFLKGREADVRGHIIRLIADNPLDPFGKEYIIDRLEKLGLSRKDIEQKIAEVKKERDAQK